VGSTPCLLYIILCVVFEARVINLCDRDIAINFGAVAKEVDLEIESTLRRLRKEARLNTMAITRQQTLKELAAPNVENQPLCINIDNNVNFELKSGFIHLLPTFNGLAGEDPHTHLKEFHMVCVGMKLNGVDEEQVKLKAFPFSLELGMP